MAYTDQRMTGSKIVAIVIVAIIHAIIGYAFITGLAYQYVKKAAEKMDVFDVEEPPPPPPDEPPPPPPDTPMQPPPVVTPPPIVQTNTPPPVVMQSVTTPPPAAPVTPVAAPPAAAPPAPRISKSAGPRGNPNEWITQEDYPPAALRAEAAGTVSIVWDINTQGRVENCRVTSSSGNRDLDETACRLITRRGKYSPALDQDGNPIKSSDRRRVTWRLPDE